MPATLTTFDGTAIGTGTDYDVRVLIGTDAPYDQEPALLTRLDRGPLVESTRLPAREIPFTLVKRGTATDVVWQQAARALFNPQVRTLRTLAGTWEGTNVELPVLVRTLTLRHDDLFEGTFLAPDPAWRSASASTDSASPLTAGGNLPALPVITITPSGSTLKRVRATVTDTTGRGLAAYPLKITFDSTGVSAAAASDYLVMFQGRPVPFRVSNMNNAATILLVRLDVPPAAYGSTYVDIYYGSSLNNTVTADALDAGGHDWTNAGWTNTAWRITGWNVAAYPDASGVWRPATVGSPLPASYQLSASIAASVTFVTTDVAGTYRNDANALVMVTGVEAGTTNALAGLAYTISGAAGVLYYRTAGALAWTQATTFGPGSSTLTADIDGAVEIAVVVPSTAGAGSGIFSGTMTLALDSSKVPTISVGSAVTAHLTTGVLSNTTTGDVITLTDVLSDGAFDIDCLDLDITPSSGPLYRAAIHPSNRSLWFPLRVGSNAWTDPAGAAASFSFKPRWAI
jgi:hypothetical protein